MKIFFLKTQAPVPSLHGNLDVMKKENGSPPVVFNCFDKYCSGPEHHTTVAGGTSTCSEGHLHSWKVQDKKGVVLEHTVSPQEVAHSQQV